MVGFLIFILSAGIQLHAQQVNFGPDSFAVTKAKAEKGDAQAQHFLGTFYYLGRGEKQSDLQNYLDAAKWYRKAAEQGIAEAQFIVAVHYHTGDLGETNLVEAAKWYRKAAEQNYVNAQFELGNFYYDGQGVTKDYAEAVKWYRKAAEKGVAAFGAMERITFRLGNCYAFAQGVTQDFAEAVKWYRKAAELDDASAQYNLGVCFKKGEGVEKSAVEAFKWFRKATEQNHTRAQYNLGMAYMNGEGVEKNEVEAVKWLRKAAEQNDASAQFKLGVCYAKGYGVEKNKVEAIKWYRKAAEQNDASAQDCLGYCYANGDGVEKSAVEAVKWFRKAAEQNVASAQYALGGCYYNGKGVLMDYAEAYKWNALAAAQGNEKALNRWNFVFKKELTPEQIGEGQRRAAIFVPHKETLGQQTSISSISVSPENPTFTGTGFFITDDGYLISNYHVVKGAAKVRLVTSAGLIDASVVKVDAANDMALLKAVGRFAPLPIASSRSAKLGGSVATVGFPSVGLQGFSPKLAKGEIASLAGASDDPRYFQISVPVQPGNSGGALVDARGNVVGIVAAKLNASAALAMSGSLPENVNYAVKSSLLLSFLESVPEVASKLKDPLTAERKFEDVVKSAQDAAVLVLVY